MSSHSHLPIYEEVLLLALDDEKGTTELGSMFANAMGGAILAELAMNGAIRITSDKKKTVTQVGRKRQTDPVLAECLAMIADAKKPRKAADWVTKFSRVKDLKNRVALQLVDKKILKQETGSVMKIFKRTIYPEARRGPEQELRERMKKAIFTSTSAVAPRTIVVVALTSATSMLPKIFDKKKLKERKKRIEDLTSGQVVGKATKEAVEAVQAAVVVCTMVPIIASTST